MRMTHCFNLVYYQPKLWEILVLHFVPLEIHLSPGAVVWYKRFLNRMYIYGYSRGHQMEPQEETSEGSQQWELN